MTDNELIGVLALQMENALALRTDWRYKGQPYIVEQANQPTQQGMPYGPMATFTKLYDRKYGWSMGGDFTYDESNDLFIDQENQIIETTFQIEAFVIQDPEDLSIPTASDVVLYLSQYLAHRSIVKSVLENTGAGIVRVTDVRNPYFEDDRHRNEASPNFDITMSYTRTLALTVPAVHKVVPKILPVLP